MLYKFFCYIIQSVYPKEYPDDYELRWYNEKDRKFHVPVDDVKGVLDKYFEDYNFDPTKLEDYNPKTNCIDYFVDGYGGARFPKFVKKERIAYDTLRITIRITMNTIKRYGTLRLIRLNSQTTGTNCCQL